MKDTTKFDRLIEIIDTLRSPEGCPWDREQTHESIKQYLIEEAFEVIEAVEDGSDEDICEELGDVLLHVIFHAQIAYERGAFDINDVIDGISEKIIGRHPHVFAEGDAKTSEEVLREWEQIKLREKKAKKGKSSLLDGLPMSMPALLVAQRMQEKASRIGFDWPDAKAVWDKVREEFAELDEVIAE
ncbi:MAG: nucleoside triphosphate pyrophosphohydrolase, partial [bacterium]